MGEAKRRKDAPAGSIEIKGPSSYEIGAYRLDDILAGSLMALFDSDRAPSARALAIIQATAKLAARMGDRRLPTMLCMTCDYEFARAERPTEIMVALPWANPEHPPIVSPICAACAEVSPDAKTNMAKVSWAKFSPGSSFNGPGHA
jgi:hypothetical protein